MRVGGSAESYSKVEVRLLRGEKSGGRNNCKRVESKYGFSEKRGEAQDGDRLGARN